MLFSKLPCSIHNGSYDQMISLAFSNILYKFYLLSTSCLYCYKVWDLIQMDRRTNRQDNLE